MGLRFGTCKVNHVAYADDITLLSTTAIAMQHMLNICHEYSITWRFMYNPIKSQCILVTETNFPFQQYPNLFMGAENIPWNDTVTILGCVFNKKGNSNSHVEDRINKCQRSFYALLSKGLAFPHGMSNLCKSFVFKSICQPTLLYCTGALSITPEQCRKMNSCQGSIVKRFMGLPARCHHSNLLTALNIDSCDTLTFKNNCSTFYRACLHDSPIKDICTYLMCMMMALILRTVLCTS